MKAVPATARITVEGADGTHTPLANGAVDVAARSVATGPITGAARDIATIYTPVGGWSSVINVADAILGADEQTDESLRVTRDAIRPAPALTLGEMTRYFAGVCHYRNRILMVLDLDAILSSAEKISLAGIPLQAGNGNPT